MKRIKLFLRTSGVLILLASCSGNDKQKTKDATAPDSTQSSQNNVNADPSIPAYYKIVGDSIEIPSFEIQVSLSEKAEEKLKNDKETIIVDAMISGTPKDTTLPEYMESGQYFITSHKIELTDARTAKFEGIKMSKQKFDSLADKDVEVLVNIYSGRRASADNILYVDILQKPISKIMNGKFVLSGELIMEKQF